MKSGARAFLLPVVIDGTRDSDAHVPAEFRAVQWTRLPEGETPAAFCARVKRWLDFEASSGMRERFATPRLNPETPTRAATSRRREPRLARAGDPAGEIILCK